MDNSYISKVTSLVGALIRSPRDFPSYLRYLPLWGCQPIDCEVPWISFGALRRLEAFVRPSHSVFEYGGGGSTLWFARRARSVLTMESHPEWHRIIATTLATKGLANVSCELQILSGETLDSFQEDIFFRRVESGNWDIILVDCYCGHNVTRYGYTRPFALELAMRHVSLGGIVVLDDSWMFKELLGPRPGWHITDYVGPGPCRYGVTSTAIFEKLR